MLATELCVYILMKLIPGVDINVNPVPLINYNLCIFIDLTKRVHCPIQQKLLILIYDPVISMSQDSCRRVALAVINVAN